MNLVNILNSNAYKKIFDCIISIFYLLLEKLLRNQKNLLFICHTFFRIKMNRS